MHSLLQDTAAALGGVDARHCDSRSLLLGRYARPLSNEQRKSTLERVVAASRSQKATASTRDWLRSIPAARHVHARLDSRLLVNVNGSVMENAGLSLDRYGAAIVPGSAVKGCARRAAIAVLREWCTTGQKPDGQHPLGGGAAPFNTPADLLLGIVRVFGVTDLEWESWDAIRQKGNDLAWACDTQWEALRDATIACLGKDPGCNPGETKPTRCGGVAFLAAVPTNARDRGDLELDVLTSHHQEYYAGKRSAATDDEDPNPVYFPASAPGESYLFTLVPLTTPAAPQTLQHAETWLIDGLTTLGLGAKTAAGYGVFSDETPAVRKREAEELAKRKQAEAAAAEKARLDAEAAARRDKKVAREQMSADDRADADLADRAGDWGWFKPHLLKFATLPEHEQRALLRWLANEGRERWVGEIKPQVAQNRKPWSQIIGFINGAKKKHKIELP